MEPCCRFEWSHDCPFLRSSWFKSHSCLEESFSRHQDLDLLGKVLAWRSLRWWAWALSTAGLCWLGCLSLVRACPSGPMATQTCWLNTCSSCCCKHHHKSSLQQAGPKFSVRSYVLLCSRLNLGSEYSRIPVHKWSTHLCKSLVWVTKNVLFSCCGAIQDLEVAIQYSGKSMTSDCKQEGI